MDSIIIDNVTSAVIAIVIILYLGKEIRLLRYEIAELKKALWRLINEVRRT